jgi:hypothetical protein
VRDGKIREASTAFPFGWLEVIDSGNVEIKRVGTQTSVWATTEFQFFNLESGKPVFLATNERRFSQVEGDLERNEATPRDAKTVWEPKAESERSTAGGELLRWKTAKRSVDSRRRTSRKRRHFTVKRWD